MRWVVLLLVVAIGGAAMSFAVVEPDAPQELQPAEAVDRRDAARTDADVTMPRRIAGEPASVAVEPAVSTPSTDVAAPEIEVVGYDGLPRVGVPVRIIGKRVSGRSQTQCTDAHGRVRFLVVDPGDDWMGVEVSVLGGRDVTAQVWPRPDDAPATRLELPPIGAVRIEAFGPDGRRWRHPLRLNFDDEAWRDVVDGGVTLFPVRAGARVVLYDRTSRTTAVVTGAFAGPSPDAVSTRRIDVAYAGRTFRGRALAPSGEPITRGELRIQSVFVDAVGDARGMTKSVTATTDGRFLTSMLAGASYRAMRVRWFDEGRVRAEAEVAIPPGRDGHDAGAVHLLATRLLAAGRVRWADRELTADQAKRIHVELHPGGAEGDRTDDDRSLECDEPDFYPNLTGVAEPTRDGRYAVAVAPDGRFAIHGRVDGPFALCVRGNPGSTDLRGVHPGTRDVELVVDRMRAVCGPFTADPWARDVVLEAWAAGRCLARGRVHRGRFHVGPIPSGHVGCVVRLRGRREPIATFARIPAAIDIRGLVRAARIRVVDPDGEPIAHATIAQGDTTNPRWTDADGVAILPAGAEAVRISALDHRVATLPASVDATVTLERGIDVRIVFEPDVRPPPDTCGMVVLNRIDDASGVQSSDTLGFVSTQRHIDWGAPVAGRYEAIVYSLSDDWSIVTDETTFVVAESTREQQVVRLAIRAAR